MELELESEYASNNDMNLLTRVYGITVTYNVIILLLLLSCLL